MVSKSAIAFMVFMTLITLTSSLPLSLYRTLRQLVSEATKDAHKFSFLRQTTLDGTQRETISTAIQFRHVTTFIFIQKPHVAMSSHDG